MGMSTNRGDREYDKFIEDAKGKTALRIGPDSITNADGTALAIDKFGRIMANDVIVADQIRCTNDLLNKILLQLELITGT